MKEMVIISGKGGTGKTLITASFLALIEKALAADCDVDTPNLHLLLNPVITEEDKYYGPKIAVLNKSKCTACGKCMEEGICRFNAIKKGDMPIFNSFYCRGCKVCIYLCPENAITLEERVCGKIYTGEGKDRVLVYGQLNPGHLGSGKMVVQIRNKAIEIARATGKELILIDGAAGLGCTVISSLSHADCALLVTEPTLSAISDLARIAELVEYFQIPCAVCINKAGTNEKNERKIEGFCSEKGFKLAGKVPFDREFAIRNSGEIPVITNPDGILSKEIKNLWNSISELIKEEK